MKPYTLTRTPSGYIARWRDVTVEAETAGEAIEGIMKCIKQILWNNTEDIK